MGTNKFATMLHRNTNKITIILIYAVLEWILIVLLLLNSLFSHLITKFAIYFGLKPPCLWCSRVDHCFGIAKSRTSYRDLVCDTHAAEISQLGYCAIHKKLAKIRYMCKDCSFSQPFSPRSSADIEQKIAFLSSIAEKKVEDAETNSKCLCCDVSLSTDLYPPYLFFNEKRENEDKEEEDGIAEEHRILLSYVDEGHGIQRSDEENFLRSPSIFQCKEILEINEDDMVDTTETTEKESIKVNAPDSPTQGMDFLRFPQDSMKTLCSSPLKLENWSNFDDHFLVTIESIDSLNLKKGNFSGLRQVSNGQSGNSEHHLNSETQVQNLVNSVEGISVASKFETSVHVVEDENNTRCAVQEPQLDMWFPEFKYMKKAETTNSLVTHSEECNMELIHLLSDQAPLTQAAQTMPFNDDLLETFEIVINDSDEPTGIELPKTLIEMEMSDQELIDQPQPHAPIPSFLCLQDNSSSNFNDAGSTNGSNTFKAEDDQSLKKAEEVSIEGRTMSVEGIEEHIDHQVSKNSDVNDVDEENATKVPNHIEGLQHLHKKSLLEKKESGMEESLDGSFKSEISTGEGNLTTEHLKSVLKEERKARCALYEELEEERSANAIAAKQTMEMITRLQEEKATMRMEALQYQRMMDEQSEYDQEALQLLNELVVKVEKEKHELQMELEISRKKVLHYEAKERRLMKRKSISEMSRTHSASFSNSEDGDHLPVDFDHESVDEDSCNGHPESSNNTPANGVINVEDVHLENSKHMSILDESLADFEAEKLSILEKLKELEEKLFTLSDEEGEYYEHIKPVVLFPEENTQEVKENEDFNSQEINGNGFCKELERKQSKEKGNMSPDSNGFHFDTNGVETLDVVPNEEQSIPVSQKKSLISKFVEVNKRLAIEEEVDNVYERLQALEADREFLKQSISSLKKGDKGMDLLREILQYLRDLRSVELCTRKTSDASLA